MTTVSMLAGVAMVIMVLALAACTTNTIGVVTGYADACQGLVVPTHTTLHVKVNLYSGSNLVASETIRSGARYRFSVAPGSYRLTTWRSQDVVVQAGQMVTVNLPNVCR